MNNNIIFLNNSDNLQSPIVAASLPAFLLIIEFLFLVVRCHPII